MGEKIVIMKILFSPSESKAQCFEYGIIDRSSFFLQEIYEKRLYAISKYNEYINNEKAEHLTEFFGIKNIDEIKEYQMDLFSCNTCTAIKRYSGVSYNYLAFDTLSNSAQEYILNNTIIFSNLFGPVMAKDKIPYYKLKQGAKLKDFVFEKYYKDNFSTALDKILNDHDIVDLRAGFYEKFYQIKKEYTTYKFIKNGKVVSHFSKAYRGILLKIMAENNIIKSENIISFLPRTLVVIDENIKGLKKEIVLNVSDD